MEEEQRKDDQSDGRPREEHLRHRQPAREALLRAAEDERNLVLLVEVQPPRQPRQCAEDDTKERRRNELQRQGRVIYFFTTEDVRDDPAYVVRTLPEALGAAAVTSGCENREIS